MSSRLIARIKPNIPIHPPKHHRRSSGTILRGAAVIPQGRLTNHATISPPLSLAPYDKLYKGSFGRAREKRLEYVTRPVPPRGLNQNRSYSSLACVSEGTAPRPAARLGGDFVRTTSRFPACCGLLCRFTPSFLTCLRFLSARGVRDGTEPFSSCE